MNTRPRLALPHDVLLIVASFADRKSLLALLATCRSLNTDCGKFVLQDPVVLRGDRSIVSFIYFMRPHKRKRWRHLHSLCLCDGPISPRVAEELARVIPRAFNLQSLEFEDAEETLGGHPDLALAFAAIRTVKHIIIEYGYQHTCRMLEAMHWPLESAVLRQTVYKPDWQDPDVLDRMHPAALLKNSRATLRTLECDAWCDYSLILNTYPVYPKLESLSVAGVWCPRTAQWAISYPTLKRLTVYTIESHFTDMDEDELADQVTTRSLNMNEYATQAQQWGELEQFRGDALDLYLLGFTCRIRDVSLSLSADTLQFFAPVMATARPTHLRVSISTRLFSQPAPTYLQDPGLADLKSLELDVIVWVGGRDGYEGDTDVDRFLGHVLDLLRRASARKFTLYLMVQSSISRKQRSILTSSSPERGDSDEQSGRAPRRPAIPLSPLETWVKDVDLDALARRFLEVPSLESVKLDAWPSDRSRQKSVGLSRVRESGGQPQDAPSLVS